MYTLLVKEKAFEFVPGAGMANPIYLVKFASMSSKVLFLLPYPLGNAPSQRFRIEEYFAVLIEHGIQFDTNEFFDKKAWQVLYKRGWLGSKIWSLLKGFCKRLPFILLKCKKYDYIVVHREAAPLGPPLFEWWLSKVLSKRLIYDFDDAIWIPNSSQENRLAAVVKCFWKVKWICKWSHKVSVGNSFLAEFAKQYNNNVIVNPTCVDTVYKYNITASGNQSPPVIGWTGSHSTIQFLAEGIPALRRLEQQMQFRFVVICDKVPDFQLRSMEFKKWSKTTEIEDLSKIDIGIMPMKNDEWNEGKCGFKLIQYMALGIPAVASPVGVNNKIIDNGVNGFLCATEEEWIDRLTQLLNDPAKRMLFGQKGRQKIVSEYSITSNTSNFLSLFSN
jgi:glycosyltransferase involved in cell wall biosynthesis